MRKVLLALFLILITHQSFPKEQTPFVWEKIAFPVLVIHDSTMIQQVANELLIPIDSSVQKLSLIDINFNGPGVKDVVVVHPTYQTYSLDFVTEHMARLMQKWPVPRLNTLLLSNSQLLQAVDSTKVSYLPVIKNLHQQMRQKYGNQPMKLFYSQKDSVVQFEILNLDPETEKLWEQTEGETRADSAGKK